MNKVKPISFLRISGEGLGTGAGLGGACQTVTVQLMKFLLKLHEIVSVVAAWLDNNH